MPLDELFSFGHILEGDQLTLAYGALLTVEGGQEDLLLTATVDLSTQQVQWSNPTTVPQEYVRTLFYPYNVYYPILDQKLYFSTGESAAYFDLSTQTFTVLEDLPEQLDSLFPGIKRTYYGFLYEGRNVWVALRDDQVLGVLEQSLENNTITCYDSAFQQTSQVELPFSLYNLQPQASVTPFPI